MSTPVSSVAVRLHGKNDLRVETIELPPIGEDQILTTVISDSICMSTHKAAIQGSDHKRVPDDIATNPVMVGHELCGEIVEVGAKWKGQFEPGSVSSSSRRSITNPSWTVTARRGTPTSTPAAPQPR
jgi:threonine dehydrogenase-like Zn-dependent dehydrogenase